MNRNSKRFLAVILTTALLTVSASLSAFNLGGLQLDLPGGNSFGNNGKQSGNSINVDEVWNLVKAGKSLYKGFEDLTPEQEYYLGRATTATLLANYREVNRKAMHRYLNSLVMYLSRFSDRPETFSGYRVQVVDDKQARAYSAPGGFIVISTGMLSLCDNEDELAAVLAHEIGHVTQKHGLSAIKTANLVEAGKYIGGVALGDSASYQQASMVMDSAFNSSIDDIVGQLVESGFSVSQEEEADRQAAKILVRAGYRVQALTDFLRKTAGLETDKAVDFKNLSEAFNKTHPGSQERIGEVNAVIRDWQVPVVEVSARRTGRFKKEISY